MVSYLSHFYLVLSFVHFKPGLLITITSSVSKQVGEI